LTFVKTRWHSRIDQAKKILEHWNDISNFYGYIKDTLKDQKLADAFQNFKKSFEEISFKLLDHVVFYCKITQPLRSLIKYFETRTHVTISYLVFGIQKGIFHAKQQHVDSNDMTNFYMKKKN